MQIKTMYFTIDELEAIREAVEIRHRSFRSRFLKRKQGIDSSFFKKMYASQETCLERIYRVLYAKKGKRIKKE